MDYDELFSLNNIFMAWKKFRRGKTKKVDIMNFEMHLEDNIFSLHKNLKKYRYKHSSYKYFQVFDNKKRDIYKAEVKDRLVHQIIFDYLLIIFEHEFISDSYASRKYKGQHKAVKALRYFIKLISGNHRSCFILKCDVKKYFDSVDQNVLLSFLKEKIKSRKILNIMEEIIESYSFSDFGENKGIPLGNITSQIFANIYLSVLDKYVKNVLRCRFYIRYNDDFVIISNSKEKLEIIRNKIICFVNKFLLLSIPLEKTSIRKTSWGVDFLGFTILPRAVLLRNKTKNKIYSNIKPQNAYSYFGLLKYCNSFNLKRKILAMDKINKSWYY